MQFSDPVVVANVDRIGWHADWKRYQFQRFAIDAEGEILYETMLVPPTRHASSRLLAPQLCPDYLGELSAESAQTQLIWALATCLCHNLVVTQVPDGAPRSVVLNGSMASTNGPFIAAAMGCGQAWAAGSDNQATRRGLIAAHCVHDLPTLLQFGWGSYQKTPRKWLADPQLNRAILCPAKDIDIDLSELPHLIELRTTEHPYPLGRIIEAAAWIVPAYLQDTCRRGHPQRSWDPGNSLDAVATDLADWFGRVGGQSTAVLAAGELLKSSNVRQRPTNAPIEIGI